MPSDCTRIPLNNELFFKYFVCDAFSKASNELLNVKDRLKMRIAAIAFGIFTLGIGTLVCRCYYYERTTISPDNLLKMKKQHLIKRFSGTDVNKIKLINSSCDPSSKSSILLFRKYFDILRDMESEEKVGSFCIRNKDRIRSSLLPYICAFEVAELLTGDSASKYEEIQKLEAQFLSPHHMKVYREWLLEILDSSILVEKIIHSQSNIREELFEALFLKGMDFSKFSAIYSSIKQKPNFLLESTLNKKIRILAFACEILSSIESKNLDSLFRIIDLAVESLGPLNYNEQESLRNFLYPAVTGRKINMIISFLIVEKGSPLHDASRKEKRVELARTILRQGSVKKFVHEEDKVEVEIEKPCIKTAIVDTPVTTKEDEQSFITYWRSRLSNIFTPT